MMHTIPIRVTTTVLPLLDGTISRQLHQQVLLEHTKHIPVAKCRPRFQFYLLMVPLLAHLSQEWLQA